MIFFLKNHPIFQQKPYDSRHTNHRLNYSTDDYCPLNVLKIPVHKKLFRLVFSFETVHQNRRVFLAYQMFLAGALVLWDAQ